MQPTSSMHVVNHSLNEPGAMCTARALPRGSPRGETRTSQAAGPAYAVHAYTGCMYVVRYLVVARVGSADGLRACVRCSAAVALRVASRAEGSSFFCSLSFWFFRRLCVQRHPRPNPSMGGFVDSEELAELGYTVVRSFLTPCECERARAAIDGAFGSPTQAVKGDLVGFPSQV